MSKKLSLAGLLMRYLTVLSLSMFVLLIAMGAPQSLFAEQNRMTTLQIDTKDPLKVYSMTLWPVFGPLAAHHYLASSPIRWREPVPEIRDRAVIMAILNVAAIGGGIALMATSERTKSESRSYYSSWNESWYTYSYPVKTIDQGQYYFGLGLAVLGPYIMNHFLGDYFARWTVNYNKRLYKQFGYEGEPLSFQLKMEPEKINVETRKKF
jgi:hypothetical protein